MTHKEWLDNEYSQWIKALQESTVHNFKEHPMVKRMLGEVEDGLFVTEELRQLIFDNHKILTSIDNIGYQKYFGITGTCQRMIYWAQQVLKQNPKSIVEIGGGVGEFYAILRALGYKGLYYIYDLPEVKEFQYNYLAEVERLTGLNTVLSADPLSDLLLIPHNFVCSFYALGEFDDKIKQWCIDNVIDKCSHGLIVWNPHSGASPEFPATKHQITIEPTIEEGIKKITW